MFVSARIVRRFAALGGVVLFGSAGCAASASDDATMREIGRLQAVVRQNEAQMAVMQTYQRQMSEQLALLSAYVGAMVNDANARKDEMARKRETIVETNPASAAMPAGSASPLQPSGDLEF